MFERKVKDKLKHIEELLVEKNKKYGDSALKPVQVFSKANSGDGICMRIDDKLKRIANSGLNDDTEDTLLDLVGYLILLMISRDDSNNI